MGAPPEESLRRKDETLRSVLVSKSFFLATTEVTQKQWFAVMKTRPWAGRRLVNTGDDFPATYVSWTDAVKFCETLSRLENHRYRLPTEAEWEIACRAGTKSAYCFGDDERQLVDYAFFDLNSASANERYAHRVAQKRPNSFGLYDMHGNNWEWCSDWYSIVASADQVDPAGPNRGARKVVKGGSWHCVPHLCRSACRYRQPIGLKTNDIGFRVLLELPSLKNN